MPIHASRTATAMVLSLWLAGCGGGSGGSTATATGSVTVAAAPTPAPSPTPAPAAAPSPGGATGTAFPLGLTQLADFPTLSWLRRSAAVDPNPTERVDYLYNAINGQWSVRLPGGNAGALVMLATETGYDYTGGFFNSVGGHVLYTLAPGLQNPVMPLESTSVGYWGFSVFNGVTPGSTSGVLAYGVPTAAGDTPASGTGQFKLYGFAQSASRFHQILGTATVDFASGAISGDFGEGTIPQSTFVTTVSNRFVLAVTTIAADRTSLSGRLTVAGLTGDATVEGSFTGQQARELMLRWKAPYRDPATGQTQTLYGVLVGRRS